MLHKIDWFSFTYESGPVPDVNIHKFRQCLLERLPDYIDKKYVDFESAIKRKGFSVGAAIGKHTYAFLATSGLILIEHTGQGCSLLEQEGMLLDLIAAYADRATRLDVATDILTDTRPSEFCEKMGGGKTQTRGSIVSPTGDTEYIGSQKSDRWTKVYRYNAPHPRSRFLRIEYTYKGKEAKIACEQLTQIGVDEFAVMSGNRYKWGHPCYKPHEGATDAILGAWRPDRKQGKTARWLLTQAAPAMARMLHEGELTWDDFNSEVQKTLIELNLQMRMF